MDGVFDRCVGQCRVVVVARRTSKGIAVCVAPTKATASGLKPLLQKISGDVYADCVAFDADGVGLQGFFAADDVEQLDAGREVGPVDDFAGFDVKAGVVQRALHFAAVEDFAHRQRAEHVGAFRLGGEEAVFEVVEGDVFAGDGEGFHFAYRQVVDVTNDVQCHDSCLCMKVSRV